MKYCFLFFYLFGLLQPTFAQSDLCSELEKYANGIKSIDLESFSYNLSVFISNNTVRDQVNFTVPTYDYWSFHSWLENLDDPNFQDCLKHADGKVVATALIAIYYTSNIQMVYDFAKFSDDDRPSLKYVSNRRSVRFSADLTTEKQAQEYSEKVSNTAPLELSKIANQLLSICFKFAGYGRMDQDLEQFLKDHKGLTETYGHTKTLFYRVKKNARMGAESSRNPSVLFKSNYVDKLSEPEHSIYSLMLGSEDYEYNPSSVFKEEEMIQAIERLERKELLNILGRKPSSDDPDLYRVRDENYYNYDYAQMCKEILKRAANYFNKDDIHFLLERAEYEVTELKQHSLNLQFSDWYIACANLDPAEASDYLNLGLTKSTENYKDFERADLYRNLLGGDKKSQEQTLDWFYGTYSINQKNEEKPDHLINEIKSMDLIKLIVSDRRFMNRCRIQHVVGLAQRANYLAEDKVISVDLIESIWHPLSLASVETRYDQALEKYPEETAQAELQSEKLKEALIEYFQ